MKIIDPLPLKMFWIMFPNEHPRWLYADTVEDCYNCPNCNTLKEHIDRCLEKNEN